MALETSADGLKRIEVDDGEETDREAARFAPDCDGRSAEGETGRLVPAWRVVGVEPPLCSGIDALAAGDRAIGSLPRGNTPIDEAPGPWCQARPSPDAVPTLTQFPPGGLAAPILSRA